MKEATLSPSLRLHRWIALRALATLVLAVIAPVALAAPASDSLYARLGGEPSLQRLVDDYFEQVTRDPALAESFRGVDKAHLKSRVQLFLCSLSGGDCHYDGDSMKTVHAGMGISERQMNRFVELLIESMDRNGIGLREKNELLALLAPFKRDVVSR